MCHQGDVLCSRKSIFRRILLLKLYYFAILTVQDEVDINNNNTFRDINRVLKNLRVISGEESEMRFNKGLTFTCKKVLLVISLFQIFHSGFLCVLHSFILFLLINHCDYYLSTTEIREMLLKRAYYFFLM